MPAPGRRAASGSSSSMPTTLVSAAAVRGAIEAMDAGAAGGGAAMRFAAGAPWWARLLIAATVRFQRALLLAAGCFLFCTRRAFEAAGGFDERYFCAEEWVLSNALKRQGRFVVLRAAVVTSARKAQPASARRAWLLALGVVRHGLGGLRERRNCGFWYDR
jgi:GT2 family glycosyltransferase